MGATNIKRAVILLTEIVFILSTVFGFLPLEAGIFLTAILAFYFLFSPLEDSIWIFVASLPLFVALTWQGESMINWRILIEIIFLVWLIENFIKCCRKKGKFVWPKEFFSSYQKNRIKSFFSEHFVILSLIFIAISYISLIDAAHPFFGAKKIAFLTNAFLLFVVTRDVIIRNPKFLKDIFTASRIAIAAVLSVGFIQLITIFWAPLHNFWKFWALKIIPVFYGQALGELLAKSNTWFSYYPSQPPTLRMFSIFPDSHSFALFCIMSLPFFLTPILLNYKKNKKFRALLYLFLALDLLAIIFSGSRGTWVSAVGVLIVFSGLVLLVRSSKIKSKTDFFKPLKPKNWSRQIQLTLGSLLIFFMLFPVASGVFLLSQKAQSDGDFEISGGVFERAKSIADTKEVSARSRLQIWARTAEAIAKQPILGVGMGNYPVVLKQKIEKAEEGSSAHNLYLDVASEIGIFGLLIFLAIFLIIFRDSWILFTKSRVKGFRVWAGFFMFVLIWLLGYSLFDVVLFNDKILLFFMLNLAILYAMKYNNNSKLEIRN